MNEMNTTTDGITALPAATQEALEKVKIAKAAWLSARQKQNEAGTTAATIRTRRDETEAEVKAMNEEWRTLFRESKGSMSPRMKKLRIEIALGRETLEEFESLLSAHEFETETLPWTTADLANTYVNAHEALITVHSRYVWSQFMALHGDALLNALSMRMYEMRCLHASGMEGINDASTMFNKFINKEIIAKAKSWTPSAEGDALLKESGMYPTSPAHNDIHSAPNPIARFKREKQRDRILQERAQ